MNNTNTSKVRLEWIDALRGLAAIGVAIMHLYELLRKYFPSNPLYQKGFLGFWIYDFLNLGKIGVVTFFLISGFVIPYSFQKKTIKEFAITRFFRLYPAYWCSVILSVFILGFPSTRQLLANISMFQKFLGVDDLLGVYWTLQVELIFYSICIVMFYKGVINSATTITRTYYFFLIVSIILGIARYVTDRKLPVALPLGLGIMVLGMICKKYSKGEPKYTRSLLIWYILLFIITIFCVSFLAYNKDFGFDEAWYKYFFSYTTAILIFYMGYKYKWYNKFFVFLGRISYSLYLLHPIAFLIVDVLKREYYPTMNSGTCILLFFGLTSMFSIACYYLIEKPAIRVGQVFLKNQGSKRDPVIQISIVNEKKLNNV